MTFEKNIYYLMLGFAFFSFITIAGGNIILGLATLFFILYLYKRRMCINLDIKLKKLFWVIVFFLITMMLSALFSGDLVKGFKYWTDLWIWRLMPLLIMVIVLNEYNQAKHVMMATMLGISAGFLCIFYQGMLGNLRAPGFFGNPMTFGGFLCVYLPFILVNFFEQRMISEYRFVSGVLFLAGFAALLINGTRGAWVALAPVFFVLMGYYGLQSKKILAVCIIFMIISTSMLGTSKHFIDKINSTINYTDEVNIERYAVWEGSYNMFKDHPVLGVGLGQYKDNYQKKYILKKARNKELTHAHNNVMQMLAENGLVGCVGFLTLVFYIFGSNVNDFIKKRCPYSMVIASSTFALFVQGLTEYNFGNSAVMKSYWLLLGCMLVMKKNASKNG